MHGNIRYLPPPTLLVSYYPKVVCTYPSTVSTGLPHGHTYLIDVVLYTLDSAVLLCLSLLSLL